MIRLTNSVLYTVGFLLFFTRLSGQNLPEYHFKMLMNDTLTFELFSYVYPFEVEPFAINGELYYPSDPPVLNIYPVDYIPNPGFTGKDQFVFQYRGNPGSGYFTWAIKYARFTVEVLPSVLEVHPDNVVIEADSPMMEIDVLANDHTTHPGITLQALTNVYGGNATISQDNTILFEVTPGFSGKAYLNYVASDQAGSKELGQLSIQVIDTEDAPETIDIALGTLNTRSLSLLLPSNDFVVDNLNQPVHGSIDLSGDNLAVYTPAIDFGGTDFFVLENAGQERRYTIEIYDIPNDGHAVVDDEVYTIENTEVHFNVLENDFLLNYMDEWTQPDHGYVNYLGSGNFYYVPDEDYHGYDEFTYTMRVAPIVFQTATVRIGVGNFNPVQLEEYQLNTRKNQAVLIEYDIPVQDFIFETVNDPENGTLTIYPGWQTVQIGCDTVYGYNLLVYLPDPEFTGTDNFEVDYCPTDANCRLVKVEVRIIDEDTGPDCSCVGSDCVWKGDTNGDGKVNVRDLFPIGLFMGAEGNLRDTDPSNWLGLDCDDWQENQGFSGNNLKHVDCDGNGIINAADTMAISDHYDNIHTIIPQSVNAVKAFPLYILTNQDTVAAGDWLYLEIGVGDASNPVIDLTGLSYSLQFPPELIDSSSLIHEFYTESWFANASSSLQMDKQPIEGKLDAGFTRIGGKGASGYGIVAKCDFIVEDDLDGLKLKSDILPLTIRLEDVAGAGPDGETFLLPLTEKTIYLDLRKKTEAPLTEELILYPNPAQDRLTIHVNGTNNIQSARVYTSTGMLKETIGPDSETNRYQLDISNYFSGVYFIEVFTANGKTAQRFEVIK